jgi:hypothetical protein
MSATQIKMVFLAIVEDVDQWPRPAQDACATTTQHPDDWAQDQLEAAMWAAGQQFIAEHPGLFRGEMA